MKSVVEACTPYKPNLTGEILSVEDDNYEMKKCPKGENATVDQVLADAKTFLNYHHDKVTFHGIKFGKGMKSIMVPKFSKGTLLTWSEGLTGISVVEHNSDSHIHVKEGALQQGD